MSKLNILSLATLISIVIMELAYALFTLQLLEHSEFTLSNGWLFYDVNNGNISILDIIIRFAIVIIIFIVACFGIIIVYVFTIMMIAMILALFLRRDDIKVVMEPFQNLHHAQPYLGRLLELVINKLSDDNNVDN